MSGRIRQFNLVIVSVALHFAITTPALAQRCPGGVATDRALGIVGAYVITSASAITINHDKWWGRPTTGFHFRWGGSPSKGHDILLHAAISHHISQVGAIAWRWACFDEKSAAWMGAALGTAVGLPKEIGDGFQQGIGFGVDDFLGGAAGAVLPALWVTWPVTRMIVLKVNYSPSDEYRDRTGDQPTLLTDYAGQRYFLAVNPGLLPGGAGGWPDWLGVALGHGVPHWISQPPIREWYLTLDMNLRGLPIRSGWWRTVATLLDQVHFPAPGVRLRNGEVVIGLF